MVVHCVDILGVRVATPNETKISHRWRKRAVLRISVLDVVVRKLTRRSAVGWSDWL